VRPAEIGCLDFHNHTPCPAGYLQWHEWAQHMSKTHKQIRCPRCKLWAIWVRKPKAK